MVEGGIALERAGKLAGSGFEGLEVLLESAEGEVGDDLRKRRS